MRSSRILVVALAFVVAPLALAMNDQLDKARDLFQRQNYSAAQEVAIKVDRAGLSKDEQDELDRMLNVLPTAIQAGKRADQEAADAEAAFSGGKWDDAERLYKSISTNEYAKDELRKQATERLPQIDEKRKLGGAIEDKKEPALAAPGNKVEGLDTTTPPAASAPATPRRVSLIDEIRDNDRLQWERAEAKMREAIRSADAAAAAQRFDEARAFVLQAQSVIEAAKAFAQPPSKYEAARAQALDAATRLDAQRREFESAKTEAERQQITQRIEERKRHQDELRREKVEQLFNTGRQLSKEQRFGEAAEAMREILFIDPTNALAAYMLDTYEDWDSYARQVAVKNTMNRQFQAQMSENYESLIPWDREVLYPRNWQELTLRRRNVGDVAGSEEDSELNRKLEVKQPEVNFESMPFSQAVDFLSDVNQFNMAVDWEDLSLHGIERDKPVSLRLRDVSLKTVLETLLSQAGGNERLGYRVGEGLMRIASRDKLDRAKFILVYDIRDLLGSIPNFTSSESLFFDGNKKAEPVATNTSIFGDTSSSLELHQANAEAARTSAQSQYFMDLIRQMVAPDSWREAGGGDSAMRELNGQLIVYQTSEAHRQVRDLLSQLREAADLMISVEGRFLSVTNNFLEQLGVDLDFVFNSGTAGYDRAFSTADGSPLADPFTGSALLVPRQYSRAGVLPATPAFGAPLAQGSVLQPYTAAGLVPYTTGAVPESKFMTPIAAQQGSLNLTDPSQISTGVANSFGGTSAAPALNIAGSFLDNLQIDFLIRATQADRRSSVVQAPRLMLLNGQRAFVAVTRNHQYVSTVTPTVATAAVGVAPVPANASSGIVLDVQGTISADRRYVRMVVRTSLQSDPVFTRFEVSRASGNSPGVFVLLPDSEIRQVQTAVTVPDGGTVLLGGLKQVGEVEVEAGVPILSKIPVLKRAFTNSTTVKDTNTLLILLKAKIMIQSEAENEAFAPFASERPG